MPVIQFREAPRVDCELVEAVESLLEAVKEGRVRTLGMIVINPLLQAESIAVGDLTVVPSDILLAQVSRLFNKLVNA
jgi:hypothetical protein